MSRTYTTILGDTWDYIAYKTLGNERYMNNLIEANPSHRETVIFSAGIVLAIPEPKAKIPSPLPPWKRG